MQTVRLTLPRPHDGQRAVIRGAKRFNVIVWGRRAGKTVLGENRLIRAALSGQPVAWFSPTYKMLSEVWREVRGVLYPMTSDRSEQEHRIGLIGGGVIDFWSLDNPDVARGRHYKRVIVDEAAMIRQLEEAWTQVIRPTLADLKGDAFFGSTPKGLNYFYNLYQMADKSPEQWARWQMPSWVNPHIPRPEIDSMIAELPERVVQQEVRAEFVTDGAYFQNIDAAAIVDQPDTPDQHAGHHVVMGVDWALSGDYTVLTVGCRDCNRVVDWQRFNQLDFTYQRERLVDMATRWKAKAVLPERNSIGEPNIEMLRGRVSIAFGPDHKPGWETTATTKPMLIQALAGALEHGGLLVPRDYADELRMYEVETMASGHPRFSAPSGAHDDRVISLALCWQAMARTGPYILFGA